MNFFFCYFMAYNIVAHIRKPNRNHLPEDSDQPP